MMQIADRVVRGRDAIALAKSQGKDTSRWEAHLADLIAQAGQEPDHGAGLEPWILWEWRRVSIPEWRGILDKCLQDQDHRREDYARWMLREILLDPNYVEDQS